MSINNIYSFIKNLKELVKSTDSNDKLSWYKLSTTCQIPKLEMIYWHYFYNKPGTFVEVGAYDGEYASNTSGLADLGWKGYYIEPIPEYYNLCRQRYSQNSNVKVSNFAIGECNKEIDITIAGPLSTISNDMCENFKRLNWASSLFINNKKIRAKMITLEEYFTIEDIQPNFELLVIDVEGYEWNVINGFNIQKWSPQMVIIELHDQNDDYQIINQECKNIVNYFDENHYRVIYKDFSNTIYIPKNELRMGINKG